MSAEGYSDKALQVPATSGVNDTGTCEPIGTPLTQGYTYFVRRDDLIKIGFTAYPTRRMKNLAREFPGLRVLAIVASEVAGEFETHQRFASLRQEGEWFLAVPELIAFISSLPRAAVAQTIAVPVPPPVTSPRDKMLTAIRGKVRRETDGVRKQQLELLAAMIENGVPAAYLAHQAQVMEGRV